MASRAIFETCAGSCIAASARACPIERRPEARSARTASGSSEQPQAVGHGRAVLADRLRDFLLREVELVHQAAVGGGLLDGVQVLALDVLDERHLEQAPFVGGGHIADDDRDAAQAGQLGGAPAPLARDDLVGSYPTCGRRSAG